MHLPPQPSGYPLSPIYLLTGSDNATIRIGSALIALMHIADIVRYRHPDPVIWNPAYTRKVFVAGNAAVSALQLVNVVLGGLGILEVGFLLLLSSPAGIFYNFVRELGTRPRGPADDTGPV